MSKFSSGRSNINSDYTTYFDWVLVRKYASPEPTWGAWGDEELETFTKTAPNLGVYHIDLSEHLAISVLKHPYKVYFIVQDIAAKKIISLI